MRFAIALAALLLGSIPAAAQCPIPPAQSAGIQFFLGIEPSDSPLDVWCRLQALDGDYRVNVLFPTVEAHRTFETRFDRTPSRPKEELAVFIQSLLPIERGPSADEAGMKFSEVLKNSVQGISARTPNGDLLGLPSAYPNSSVMALWEPISLRVRPVTIAGAEFNLVVNFKPSVGRLLMSLEGHAEALILNGWRGNMMDTSNTCPDTIPLCKELPEVVRLYTAWSVESVVLEAFAPSLSGPAIQIFNQIYTDNRSYVRSTNLADFRADLGAIDLEAFDGARVLRAKAYADPNGVAGAQRIRIRWGEREGTENSYSTLLAKWALQARQALVLSYPSQ